MLKWFLPLITGYVVTNIIATTLAIGILQPFVSGMFGSFIRTDADGLAFVPLLAGYLVITVVLVWLVPRVKSGCSGWLHGAVVGLALGAAVFLGDHLVTAGWSKIPELPMFLSGLIDSLAVMTGGVVIAVVQQWQTTGEVKRT